MSIKLTQYFDHWTWSLKSTKAQIPVPWSVISVFVLIFFLCIFSLLFHINPSALVKLLIESITRWFLGITVCGWSHWLSVSGVTALAHVPTDNSKNGYCASSQMRPYNVSLGFSVGSWEYLSMGPLVLCWVSPRRRPPQPTELTWVARSSLCDPLDVTTARANSLDAASRDPDLELSSAASRFLILSIHRTQSVLFPSAKFWGGLLYSNR